MSESSHCRHCNAIFQSAGADPSRNSQCRECQRYTRAPVTMHTVSNQVSIPDQLRAKGVDVAMHELQVAPGPFPACVACGRDGKVQSHDESKAIVLDTNANPDIPLLCRNCRSILCPECAGVANILGKHFSCPQCESTEGFDALIPSAICDLCGRAASIVDNAVEGTVTYQGVEKNAAPLLFCADCQVVVCFACSQEHDVCPHCGGRRLGLYVPGYDGADAVFADFDPKRCAFTYEAPGSSASKKTADCRCSGNEGMEFNLQWLPTPDDTPRARSKETELCQAVMEGNLTQVDRLLPKERSWFQRNLGINDAVNGKDGEGRRLLFLAANRGNVETAQLLLSRGAKIKGRSADGLTALHGAVMGWNTAVVELIAQQGADIEARDDRGRTPLAWAALLGWTEGLNQLLNLGADLDAKDSCRRRLLHLAARYGHGDIAEALVEAGASVETKDSRDMAPLAVAVENRKHAVVERLLRAGADASARTKNGLTLLHIAARDGASQSAQLLIDAGADISAEDSKGHTPAHWAALSGRTETLAVLLDNGADVNITDKQEGAQPIHCAALGGKRQALELLVARGANVNARTNIGMTPLHVAAQSNNAEIMKRLLELGAAINATDASGWAPIHTAARDGAVDAVRLLLESGVNPDWRISGAVRLTPLHVAAGFGRVPVIRLLREFGADLNAKADGLTPREGAEVFGRHEAVEALQ